MMVRKTFGWMVIGALTAAGCSGTAQTPMSPSATMTNAAALNPDGSTMKVTAPRDLGPANNVVVSSPRPTLAFTNSTGVYLPLNYTYEIEIVNLQGAVVYTRRNLGETANSSSHNVDADLPADTMLWWRVRAHLGGEVGPWSEWAQFRTPPPPGPPPPPPPPPGGGLPFPIPAECGPFGAGNRIGCVAAIASQSLEWVRCRSGSGVGCHRFTRQIGFALAQSDPGWALIQAGPGGHACNCFGCGPSDGTWFREDTVVYNGRDVFDMIVGAGGPSPGLQWAHVGGLRGGDFAVLPPVCPQ